MGHSGVIQEQLGTQNSFLSVHSGEIARMLLACMALFIAGLATTNSPLFETIQYETSHIRLLSSEMNAAENISAPVVVDAVLPAGKKKLGIAASSTSSLSRKISASQKPSVTMIVRSNKPLQARQIAEYRDLTR